MATARPHYPFEWDDDKATENETKHGVSFEEAATDLQDPLARTMPGEEHSDEEERILDIGESGDGRVIVVAYTMREDVYRIISARPATPAERRQYKKDNGA